MRIPRATTTDDGTYIVKRLKWPCYVGEAKRLSEQFKAFYASLTAVYTVSTSYVFRPGHVQAARRLI